MPELLTSDDIFAVFLIFMRIGAAIMLMPGFSEPYIFSRSRLFSNNRSEPSRVRS